MRSIKFEPVNSYSARPKKKLSQSQPARSLVGQSVNISKLFCAKVSSAADRILFISASLLLYLFETGIGHIVSVIRMFFRTALPFRQINLRYFTPTGSMEMKL